MQAIHLGTAFCSLLQRRVLLLLHITQRDLSICCICALDQQSSALDQITDSQGENYVI